MSRRVMGLLGAAVVLLAIIGQGLIIQGIFMHLWSMWPIYVSVLVTLIGGIVWIAGLADPDQDAKPRKETKAGTADAKTAPKTATKPAPESSTKAAKPSSDSGLDRIGGNVALRRVGAGTLIAGFLGVVALTSTWGYLKDRAYLAHVTVQETPSPDYAPRGAFVTARAQAQTAITVNGELARTKYLATANTFTTPVRKRGPISGYGEVISQPGKLAGTLESTSCAFDSQANHRLGGWLWSSLERKVLWATDLRKTINTNEDVAFYCDGSTPMVAIPLVTLSGVWPPITVPAGVATYNGRTGQIQVLDEVATGELPAPVFPISLAERMRSSTKAQGSLIDYWLGRVGYDDTAADTEDPNSANRSEFLLARANESARSDYVTPLTLVGQATGIAAVGVIDAASVQAGILNNYTVHQFPSGTPRRSNSAIVDQIKSDYPELAWSSGLQIFEVAPIGHNEWVGSIGLKQSVTHRVRITTTGTSCLYDKSDNRVRCSDENTKTPKSEPDTPDPKPTTPAQVPLTDLTDDQLAQLLDDVSAETRRRLTKETTGN